MEKLKVLLSKPMLVAYFTIAVTVAGLYGFDKQKVCDAAVLLNIEVADCEAKSDN